MELQFSINGKQYFLTFVPDEGQWFLFTQAANGLARIPVVQDDAPAVNRTVLPLGEITN